MWVSHIGVKMGNRIPKAFGTKPLIKRLVEHKKELTVSSEKIKSVSKSIFDNQIGETQQEKPFFFFGDDFLLSPEHVARYLDVSRKFVYELIYSGQLKALTVGGRLRRIRRNELERWLASNTKGARS